MEFLSTVAHLGPGSIKIPAKWVRSYVFFVSDPKVIRGNPNITLGLQTFYFLCVCFVKTVKKGSFLTSFAHPRLGQEEMAQAHDKAQQGKA